MKKFISIILALTLCASSAALFTGCGKSYDGEVNVYNWGENISLGEDGAMDVISEFEEKYNIKVNYTNYEKEFSFNVWFVAQRMRLCSLL